MGPLFVAMPRSNYLGAFSNAESPSSKLIGCEDDEEEMIARQMASRLSQKVGIAVLVSCSFSGAPAIPFQGVDRSMINHRAAALAEKEVKQLLLEKYTTR